MHKNFLIAAAVFGALAVVLGAFGAHGLEKITADEKILHGFQTGVQYQMYHALALLALAVIFEKIPNRLIKWAGNCFIAGIILFSGSLYLLSFLKVQESNAVKFVGPITPLGGIFFITGWLFLLTGVVNKKDSQR
ncbi:MAG TPA: DUF423 domain-containing protein [Chitinophagaceae bacterium]|nr:DUF423 domain-containing protein [Chitinophagaceae bacterium]